jgi:hypothetical protein
MLSCCCRLAAWTKIRRRSRGSPEIEARPDPEPAGLVIAELVAKELDNENTVSASIQARGLAVISSSGTLVTLLFGLSALATKAQNFKLPPSVKPPLYIAAILLVAAAAVGIMTNAPGRSEAIALPKLKPLLESPYWDFPSIKAKQEVARTELKVLLAVRKRNRSKAKFLLVSIILEIMGVTSVMWAVIALIAQG